MPLKEAAMKLRTIALATALALSSTAAFAVPMPQPKILVHETVTAQTHPHLGEHRHASHWSYRYHGARNEKKPHPGVTRVGL